MKKNIEALLPDRFYHVFNRGINGENIFKEEKNYSYFLKKFAKFVEPVAETYAYCLLKNHFHFLIKIRSAEEIFENLTFCEDPDDFIKTEGFLQNEAFRFNKISVEKFNQREVSWHISNAFSSLFKSYAQSINNAHKRTGRLFEEPFRRIHIDNDAYFTAVLAYIHQNPQKHGFTSDFKDYPYSSYWSHLSKQNTKLKRAEVIAWFGADEQYVDFHNAKINSLENADFIIEFE